MPFLWELEVLLNWVCTETTLTLDYWVKLSDIKVYLFKLKCWQVCDSTCSSSCDFIIYLSLFHPIVIYLSLLISGYVFLIIRF